MTLTIGIPVYNAANDIKGAITQLTAALSEIPIDYEIILRDDGSSDDSADILKEVSARDHRIQSALNEKNRGLGFTLRKLFEDAQGDYIIYMDCDVPFDPGILNRVLTELKNYDVVVVSRYVGKMSRQIPWMRVAVSRLYYVLCKVLFNIPVKDIGSGMVALRRSAVTKMDLKADRFGIHAELFKECLKHNLSIKEIPGDCRTTRGSSFSIIRHGPGIVVDTFRLWLNGRQS